MSGMPELLYGSRPAADIPIASTALDTAASDTLVVENAEVLYVLYETPMQAALKCIPVSLHPSIPAVYGMTFVRAHAGPLGAFEAAWVGVACRTGIKPRHFIQSAYSSSTVVGEFLCTRYGFDCQVGDVRLRETFDRARGTIALDGALVLDVAITESIPLVGAGALIKYSPPLNASRVEGKPALVQFEAAYDFKRVLRGKPQLAAFEAPSLGAAELRPTHPIAGSFAVCDLHLMPPRFQVDLETPAEAGGASRIVR